MDRAVSRARKGRAVFVHFLRNAAGPVGRGFERRFFRPLSPEGGEGAARCARKGRAVFVHFLRNAAGPVGRGFERRFFRSLSPEGGEGAARCARKGRAVFVHFLRNAAGPVGRGFERRFFRPLRMEGGEGAARCARKGRAAGNAARSANAKDRMRAQRSTGRARGMENAGCGQGCFAQAQATPPLPGKARPAFLQTPCGVLAGAGKGRRRAAVASRGERAGESVCSGGGGLHRRWGKGNLSVRGGVVRLRLEKLRVQIRRSSARKGVAHLRVCARGTPRRCGR